MNNLVLDHFGFSHLPFSKAVSPKNAFHTASYKEALARLEYGVEDEDIMLLTGAVGSGKSVVLASFIASLDTNSYTPLYVRGSNLSEAALYKAVLAGVNTTPPHFPAKAKRLFYQMIPELTRKPIVVLDDAQDMQDSALRSIKSMANFDFDSTNKITFILAGQPELKAKLKLIQFLALKQRIRLFFHMSAMTLQETCAYIDHHTEIAGKPAAIFSDEAKADVHRHSEGIPRAVNTICYRSILNAALKELEIIDSTDLFLDDPAD